MTQRSTEPMSHPQFPHLFSPFHLRRTTLRNRIVMLPMGSRFAREGTPTEGDIAFYRARAQAGVGLIITGGTPVHPSGVARSRGLYEAFNTKAMPALARLAEAIHSGGATLFGQIFHPGRLAHGDADWPVWAPSPVATATDPQVPHAMTTGEVEEIVEAFGRSAANLRACGFDGIEIHAAHGYLVAQFLSPAFNHREDRYGGSPQNRMRFLLDIVDQIRARVGLEPVLGVRMSADEGEEVDDGIRLPYSEQVARALADTGKVDYVSVTMGIRGAYVKDMAVPVGAAVPLAAAVRKASGLPVIAGQRINHPALAETTLASGAADLIGMARALIADGEWAAKARDGRVEQIRPCVACVQVCRSGIMGCVHSATSGREMMWGPGSFEKAPARRKIVVVGGGPAGMEAALQATERGHEVVLFEAARRLGGQARIAALAPNRTELDGVVSYRESELARLGVNVRLGAHADARAVRAENPDAVVIATGATPRLGDVEGADLPHVIDVLSVQEPDPETERRLAGALNAVVVDDGSGFWETCSAAEALGKRGLHVFFVTPVRAVGGNLPTEAAGPALRRLRWLGVEFLPMHRVSAIHPDKVSVYDAVRLAATRVLEEKELAADVVVYYSGKEAVTGLAAELAGHVPEIHLVGDCLAPRRINHAVFEGHRVGRAL